MSEQTEQKEYIDLLIKWETFSANVYGGIQAKLGNQMITNTIPPRTLRDSIHNILTTKDYDTKAFDFIWKSVRINRPGLTREQYLKEFINVKVKPLDTAKLGNKARDIGKAIRINLFDNMDNEQTTLRIANQIEKQVKVLSKRVDRLHGYRLNLNIDSIDKSLGDVNRILKTFKTKENDLSKQIKRQNKRLSKVKGQFKKDTKLKIRKLKTELKEVQLQNKTLSKQFSKFIRTKNKLPEKKAIEQYRKILKGTEDIITKRQQKTVIKSIVDKAQSKVVQIAQTERTRSASSVVLNQIKTISKENQSDYVVFISLDPSHDIIDICDDMQGVYDLNDLPKEGLPPYHPNCICKSEIKKK